MKTAARFLLVLGFLFMLGALLWYRWNHEGVRVYDLPRLHF